MPEKESKHRTTIIFDDKLFTRAKHYVIDKRTSINALLESLLRKELDANEKKD